MKRFKPNTQACFAPACGLIAVMLVNGCRLSVSPAPHSAPASAGESAMVRTELYFGLSKSGGGEITPEEFDAFVARVVTPRFPDGLTILDAVGQWRDSAGRVTREKSKVLILLHEGGTRDALAIEEIRAHYKSQFGQESVMRVTSNAGVSF